MARVADAVDSARRARDQGVAGGAACCGEGSCPRQRSRLHALQAPGPCELVAATFFEDIAVPDDQALSRSLQHGVEGACGCGLVRNLLPGVGRYAHSPVAAGQARATTPGPVVLGARRADDVCAQQGSWHTCMHVPSRLTHSSGPRTPAAGVREARPHQQASPRNRQPGTSSRPMQTLETGDPAPTPRRSVSRKSNGSAVSSESWS